MKNPTHKIVLHDKTHVSSLSMVGTHGNHDRSASRSRQRLRDSLCRYNQANSRSVSKRVDSESRVNPVDYALKNYPHAKATNMEDPQIRIQRTYSPLYQKSRTESDLFQNGTKKFRDKNCLKSRIELTDQGTKGDDCFANGGNSIKRVNPNYQKQNFLDLSSMTQKEPSCTKKAKSRNPNEESEQSDFEGQISSRSLKRKNRNGQSVKTADYVVKALSTQIENPPKEVHLKFCRKQNKTIEENLNNGGGLRDFQKMQRQHRRHFSEYTNIVQRENIEVKDGTICKKSKNERECKQNEQHFGKQNEKMDFGQEFYRKYDRTKPITTIKGVFVKKTNKSNASCNDRIIQLRKRFL